MFLNKANKTKNFDQSPIVVKFKALDGLMRGTISKIDQENIDDEGISKIDSKIITRSRDYCTF